MKKLITLLFPALLAVGFIPAGGLVVITGTIEERVPDSSGFWPGSFVILKADNKVVGKAAINEKGRFTLPYTTTDATCFDFYFYMPSAVDTMLLFSASHFDSSQPQLTLTLPVEPRRTIFGRAYCPKCAHADKVFRIEYGVPTYAMYVTAQGDTLHSRIYNGRYQAGGCVMGPSRYYCARDGVKF